MGVNAKGFPRPAKIEFTDLQNAAGNICLLHCWRIVDVIIC